MQIQLQYHNLIQLVIRDKDTEDTSKIKPMFIGLERSEGWPCPYLVI